MKAEAATTHIHDQASEYVLGLLPLVDELRLKVHIADCHECRLCVERERAMARSVREALMVVSRPDSRRLRQLMPAVPRSKGSAGNGIGWQRRFAVALLLLLAIMVGLSVEMVNRPELWPGEQSRIYATAAITDTPTLTATSTLAGIYPRETAVPTPVARVTLPVPLPALAPIPIAPRLR